MLNVDQVWHVYKETAKIRANQLRVEHEPSVALLILYLSAPWFANVRNHSLGTHLYNAIQEENVRQTTIVVQKRAA